MRAGRRRVRLTHADKVLFPADGITKADLAAYYLAVAPAMVPHVRDRPLNLWRWNGGIDARRDRPAGDPEGRAGLGPARWRCRAGAGGTVVHAVGGETATLVWLANQNCITPHAWTSRADRPDRPDRLIFDLDPPTTSDDHFERIRAGALALGELLRELGLAPHAMTSGSRGIHVVAPLRRGPDADAVRARAGEIAVALAARRPDELTTEWRKVKREGRVLVDVARNTYGQTAVAPYAVRARAGAPVATPLAWEELEDPALTPRRWSLAQRSGAARRAGRPLGGHRAEGSPAARPAAARRLSAGPPGGTAVIVDELQAHADEERRRGHWRPRCKGEGEGGRSGGGGGGGGCGHGR